ncbi:hypothetical protein [Ruminiclostridium hungatei]|uniref:hypothetical protein n=1 Tax=Ruminiclostridium hungatei TaxID=48256 RepID=UPI0009AD0A9D|nr:hypothetical protein [Ruminiclostridium hungatei]
MRNKRRNDSYVSQRIDTIIDSIHNNPFMGFSSLVRPFEQNPGPREDEADTAGEPRQPSHQ